MPDSPFRGFKKTLAANLKGVQDIIDILNQPENSDRSSPTKMVRSSGMVLFTPSQNDEYEAALRRLPAKVRERNRQRLARCFSVPGDASSQGLLRGYAEAAEKAGSLQSSAGKCEEVTAALSAFEEFGVVSLVLIFIAIWISLTVF